MSTLSSPESSTASLWQWLISLVLANPTQVFPFIKSLGQFVHALREPAGQFEMLDLDMRWELCDSLGHEAIYKKRAKVRFLENNVIAIQDMAWGLGDIFADYQCSPGIPVDVYLEGYRYRILISLRETKNRGDIEEFHIERRITDGFLIPEGSIQTYIEQKTRKVSMSIVFPRERKPTDLRLVEQNVGRTTGLSPDNVQTLPNGNVEVAWSRVKPKRFESYILKWKW